MVTSGQRNTQKLENADRELLAQRSMQEDRETSSVQYAETVCITQVRCPRTTRNTIRKSLYRPATVNTKLIALSLMAYNLYRGTVCAMIYVYLLN